jgi:hypothetical protein
VKVTVATPLAFVSVAALLKEPPPPVLAHVTLRPEVATGLPYVSVSWAVMVTGEPAAGVYPLDVTTYLLAAAATVVIAALVPVRVEGLVLVAVTVYAAPATVPEVNVAVATPFALVVLLAVIEPPLPALLHATERPEVLTALPYWSASWALMVAVPPADGLYVLDVTRYLVAVPAAPVAANVTGEPLRPAAEAVSVLAPAVVPSVQESTVATPEAPVVAEPPLTEPPPEATAKVTATPGTGLLLASLTITLGSVETAEPAVALWPLPALKAIVTAAPATLLMAALAPVREEGLVLVAVTV